MLLVYADPPFWGLTGNSIPKGLCQVIFGLAVGKAIFGFQVSMQERPALPPHIFISEGAANRFIPPTDVA